ncbi:hypothetical protein HaLaN_00676 [Haematococcus lacustris]|uniref:Uncharacterized protein n=1 Tax=Haematococcus lacustris TaxID=44745 RepID=A0A699Y7R1_HAELA|nr:hypothetical protein HaLaN_00676 [Haematococcus lacustris]
MLVVSQRQRQRQWPRDIGSTDVGWCTGAVQCRLHKPAVVVGCTHTSLDVCIARDQHGRLVPG